MDIVNISELNIKIEEAFVKAKENIPEYEKELKIIEEVLTKCLNIEERLTLEKKQKELSSIIEDLLNDTSFGFYLIEAQKYLEEFTNSFQTQTAVSFMKKERIANHKIQELTKSFLNLVMKYNTILQLDLPKIHNHHHSKMPVICHCGNNKDFDVIDGRVYYCLKCGNQVKENVGIRSTYKDIDRVNIGGKYKYTRTIHFRNCFRQYQGKQKTRIPVECIRDIKEQLHINGITIKKSNPQHIRTALQETGWSDQYENFVLIWSIITGKSCPDVSHLEESIFQDFQLVEKTYNEIMGDPKEERTSFMSYPYVLYQLLLRQNCKCDLNFFNMLKSDRINWLDDIMEQIYFKLQWGGFKPLG